MTPTEEFFSNYSLMLKLSYDKIFYYAKHKMMGNANVFEIRMKDYEGQIYTHYFFSIWEDSDGKIKVRFDPHEYSEFFDSLDDFKKYVEEHSDNLVDKFLSSL